MYQAIRNTEQAPGPDGEVTPFYTRDGQVLLVSDELVFLEGKERVDVTDPEVIEEIKKRGAVQQEAPAPL